MTATTTAPPEVLDRPIPGIYADKDLPFVAAQPTESPEPIPAHLISTGCGKSNQLGVFVREALQKFIAEQTLRTTRAAGLLAELDDIAADRAIAYRLTKTGTWLDELVVEERDVWDRISELLSP